MRPSGWGGLLLGAIVLCIDVMPATGQRLFATPSAKVTEEYDNNVRVSAKNREYDLVTAVAPAIRLELRDHPWYLTLNGSGRAEVFAQRRELDNFTDNTQLNATFTVLPMRTLSLSVSEQYVRSLEASVSDPETGIIRGRNASTANTITPTLAYEIDRRTSVAARLSFASFRSDAEDARASDTYEASVSGQRQLEILPRDSVTASYSYSRFVIEGSGTQTSHSPRVGYVHGFSPTIRVGADVGPLFVQRDDGPIEPTVGGSARYEQDFKDGTLQISYTRITRQAGRTGGAGVGQVGSLVTTLQVLRNVGLSSRNSFSETASGEGSVLRSLTSQSGLTYSPPVRGMTVALDTTMTDTRSSGGATAGGGAGSQTDFRSMSAGVRVTYQLLRWLAIEASYRYQRQDDRVGSNTFDRTVISVGLTASDRFRID